MAISKDAPKDLDGLHVPYGDLAFFLDLKPKTSNFLEDVIDGLSTPVKSLSPKYLYDEKGSQIFDKITLLEEYYPTRTERSIVEANSAAIGEAIGPHRAVFEYGSGSSDKIGQLLGLMTSPAGYVAVDISRDFLIDSTSRFAREINVPVGAVCADFTAHIHIPSGILDPSACWLGFFPGSTIGNLSPAAATTLLERASETLGSDAKMLVGVDLEKDPKILASAYDDREGVTAAFNINLLRRMRRELDAEIDIDAFAHRLRIPDTPQRVEMHLEAVRPTDIVIGEHVFHFETGETLHTENSNKYSVERLDELLAGTPWRREQIWTDANHWFATCLLSNR